MRDIILILFNGIIIFCILKLIIEKARKGMKNSKISNWFNGRQERRSIVANCTIALCIFNLFLNIYDKFNLVSTVIFVVIVGSVIFIGALTRS